MITPNKFAGTCYRCGETVAEGAGRVDFESFPGQRWPVLHGTRNMTLVSHLACHERYHNTDVHFAYAPEDSDASS